MRISDWSSDVCSSDLQLVDSKLAKGLTVSTFHSLGLRFLREEAVHAGLKPSFSILDSTDALAIIQELLATTDKARLRAVQQNISLWKNALMDPDAADRSAASPRSEEHTSELQSLMRISYAVFCLKKKKKYTNIIPSANYNHSNHTK